MFCSTYDRCRTLLLMLLLGTLTLSANAQGKRWALLVGVEEYESQDIAHLDFAVKDVSAVAGVLHDRLGYRTRLMTSAVQGAGDPNRPTNLNVFKVLDRLSEDIKPEDTFVFYFSGHGFNKEGQNFLGTVNTDPASIETLELSAIPLATLQKKVAKLKAHQVIFIMDACRNDPEKGKGGGDNKLTEAFSKSLIVAARPQGALAGGSAVLFACSEGERAFEDPARGQSAFTFYLLEALRGKAAVGDALTMTDVAAYVQGQVSEWARDHNKKQTPELKTEGAARILLADRITAPTAPVVANPSIAAAKFKKNAQDGAEMVFIPAGEFTMGSSQSEIDALVTQHTRDNFRAEGPQHKVMLDGYYIYRTPVTVAQYLKFCEETGHRKPDAPDFNPNWSKRDHPIVNVSYNDALDYCAWAGVKLPTEAQWEKAARGTDERIYPWGNTFDRSKLWSSESHIGSARSTKPVGSFPSGASPFGVLDMAGNVYQWCRDWYDPNFYANSLAAARNPENQSVGEMKHRVVRGGSWGDFDLFVFRSAYRFDVPPNGMDISGGFRCVSEL